MASASWTIWFLFFLCTIVCISARGPPRVIGNIYHTLQAKLGKNIKLPCSVETDTMPFIKWTKDNHQIDSGWIRFKTLQDGQVLRIKDVEFEDAGVYICKVTNGFGSVHINYSLSVLDEKTGKEQPTVVKDKNTDENLETDSEKIKSKPEFIAPHPINTTVRYGSKASFQCRVKSAVQPHMQWLKRIENPSTPTNLNTTIEVNGMKLMVLQTAEVVTTPDGSHLNKLVIHRATEADAGMYICLGANSIGYNYRSAYLTVVKEAPEDPDTGNSTLPLIIAVPVCVVIVLVVVAIYMRQRRCCGSSSNDSQRQRFQVPTQDPYPPMHNPHMMQISRDKLAPKSHSVDFYSDISSVSRQHYHPPPTHYS